MNSETFNQLIASVEANRFKWDIEYSQAFEAIMKEYEMALTKRQLKDLRTDAIAFRFMTRDTTKDENDERIKPIIVYKDGSTFPDEAIEFTNEAFDYWKKRLQECENPVMKLRYADLLWEKDKRQKNKLQLGKDLISAALDASNVFDHDNELDRVDCLDRALQVALSLGKAQSALVKDVTDAILERLKRLRAENNLRFTLELIETIINFHEHFTKDDFKFCKEICEIAIKHYKDENDNFTLRGAFVDKSHKLDKLIAPSSYDSKAAAIDFAQTRIDEAEKRTDSIIVQQHFFREALKILKDAGLNNEANELNKRIEALGKDEHFDDQFKEFSFTTEIPIEVVNNLEALLKKYNDTASLIAISPNFMPLWSDAEKTAAQDKQDYISDIFSHIRYDENGMAVAVTGGDAQLSKILRYYETNTEFKVTYLRSLLRKLINEGAITQENFDKQFEKIKYIDEDTWESVKHGLELYFKGDFYSASLILTTQLEDFMFKLLPAMEVTQYIAEKDGQTHSPKTIGWFLNEIKEAVGDDIYQLCYYTLIDKAHHNIRNKIGHGKTKVTHDNELTCVRIIQIFSALLVCVNIQPKGEDSTDKKSKQKKI